ncbi:MAG: LPS export ABC transporter periplasmic protein LptC [Beijerinckiaceae bacterium]|nr:LPS export ABC transporter periplasmic protein LptC [Beijerinckiaceae bacterium]MDO9442202.1 LPS export ABC transporter periplasmic protein LptC [Beijerinckiaceae bacterium]
MNGDRSHRGAFEATRSRAFRAAGRHSSRVVFLRRFILASSILGIVALVVIGVFNPFGQLPQNVSISGGNLDGTRVTMEKPKLNGYRKDGRPYEVRASSGVQDVRKPSIIELKDLDARIGMSDRSTVRVASPFGVYDSTREFMDFQGEVSIKSDTGYDIRMQSAQMDFKAGTVVSDKPVSVVMTNGTVLADRLDITDSGRLITFAGNVRSTILPEKDTSPGDQDEPGPPKGEAP